MLIQVLGPLELRTPDGWQRLAAPKWRALLARLTTDLGGPVSVDALIDELWPADPPTGAVNQVHGYVSRLRTLLGDRDRTVLVTRAPGYELVITEDDLDSLQFERLVDQGEQALRDQDHQRAAQLFAEALRLWRGPAYADVSPSDRVRAEADRLAERRLRAQEGRIDADLECGRSAAELVVELQAAVEDHPLREHLWAQLMLALYRADRQSDALLAYQRAYRQLDSELGVQPGAVLTTLQQRILNCDPELRAPAPRPRTRLPTAAEEPAEIPHQLPADISDFIGREPELSGLDAWLAAADADEPEAPPALALLGGGGFGKTTLGLHWAHRVADQFPDGQLYVNLRGFATVPRLPATQALSAFLRALGVAPNRIPLDEDEAAALYRTRMNDRRMLVVLDNAADDQQVLPLLPGTGATRVLITSRDPLSGLIARGLVRQLRIDALSQPDTEKLIIRIVGRQRVATDPAAVGRLATVCGGLPLAARISAAHLVGNPELPVADHAAALEGAPTDRLAALDLDQSGDPNTSVRAAFDLSFARLDAPSQRLFRLLSLIPGDSFSAPAAAALIDVDLATARQLLDRLCARGMLGHAGQRYLQHDLLQAYAAERCAESVPACDQSAAIDRLLGWYTATAADAVALAVPPMFRLPDPIPATSPTVQFHDQQSAAAWLETERPELLALAAACSDDPDRAVWQLADVLRSYFFYHGYSGDWITMAAAGRQSARQSGHQLAETAAELSLTQAYRRTTRYREATRHARRALTLAESSGWQMAEGSILNELALLRMERGDVRSAPEFLQRAIEIYNKIGNHGAAATLMINLAQASRELGDLASAVWQFTAVLDLLPPESNQHAGMVHADLAVIYRLMDRQHDASQEIDKAAALVSVGMIGTASLCASRCDLKIDNGDLDGAMADAEKALNLARKQQSERLEAAALLSRFDVRIAMGDPAAALADATAAEEITRRTDTGYEWVESLLRIAQAQLRLGNALQAQEIAARAAVEAEGYGYRIEQADAESTLAEVQLQLGNPAQARDSARRAVALYQETGCRLGEQRLAELMADVNRKCRGAR